MTGRATGEDDGSVSEEVERGGIARGSRRTGVDAAVLHEAPGVLGGRDVGLAVQGDLDVRVAWQSKSAGAEGQRAAIEEGEERADVRLNQATMFSMQPMQHEATQARMAPMAGEGRREGGRQRPFSTARAGQEGTHRCRLHARSAG